MGAWPAAGRATTWRRRVRAAAAMVALLLASLLAAGAPERAVRDDGRLWRIARPGVADSFVLGTIHVADPRVARIAPPVAAALAQTRTLALETVPLPLPAADQDALEALPDGGRLEPLIGAAAYAQVRRALAAQGIAEPEMARLKPWAAMLKVARIAAPDDERSLDENLFAAALGQRMRIEPLEAVAEQAVAFDMVPLDSQVALLAHALAHRDALATLTEPAIAAWSHGDLAALAAPLGVVGDRHPEMRRHYDALAKHIVQNRTAVFHHRLFLALRGGRVFVAVGASHLGGRAGLLALLREDGYRVTPVW